MITNFLFKTHRDGSMPITRFFRRVFEAKALRFLVGINLILSTVFMAKFTAPTQAFDNQEVVLAKPAEDNIHTDISFTEPLKATITQKYSWYHQAVDMAIDIGTPVHPIADGIVKETEYGYFGYGHKIIVEHTNGYTSLYAHLKDINIKPGDQVTKDVIIGTVGITGMTSGPHLHLEIKRGDKSLNPQEVLSEFSQK